MIRRLRPAAPRLALATALLALSGLAPAGIVLALHALVAAVTADGSLGPPAALLVAVVAAQGLANLLRARITREVAGELVSGLRRELHAAWLRERGPRSDGERLSALLEEVDQVQLGVSAAVTAARNPISVAGALATAGWACPPLVPWALIAWAPVGPIALLAGARVRAAARRAREARGALAALASEQLRHAAVLRAFDALGAEEARFASRDDADRRARTDLEVARALPGAATQLALVAAVAVLVAVAARAVRSGDAAPADVAAFATGLLLVVRPLQGLAEAWSMAERARVALERVEAALAAAGAPEEARPPGPPAGGLRFAGVVPPHGAEGPVDLEVGPGELVALRGPSGAGKSTLLAIAAGEIRPVAGAVSAEPPAVVPQEDAVFSRSIAENVALSGGDPSRCLAEVGLGLPLDCRVGAMGVALSAGERRRLSLARALHRGASVWLLDEPTAHLDPAAAERVRAVIGAARGRVAILAATHDPALLALADRIVDVAPRDG